MSHVPRMAVSFRKIQINVQAKFIMMIILNLGQNPEHLWMTKDLFTRKIFSPCQLLRSLLNVFFFIVIRIMERK